MKNKRSLWRTLVWLFLYIFLVGTFIIWFWPISQNFKQNLAQNILWNLILESSGGVISAILVSIGVNLTYSLISASLVENFRKKLFSNLNTRLINIIEATRISVQTNINKVFDRLGAQVRNVITIVASRIYVVLSFFAAFILDILNFIVLSLYGVIKRLFAPKWYHDNGDAIDPGLIEVSLALTAVLIALPSLVELRITPAQAVFLNNFRFFGEAIPTLTSIGLLDRYAKNKGAKSIHILLSPIDDGPFFFLGWSIIIGLILIATITYQFG